MGVVNLKQTRLKKSYASWMYRWERKPTPRDENRVVRALEWGFDWIQSFLSEHRLGRELKLGPADLQHEELAGAAEAEAAMTRINELLIRRSDEFFGYERPADFRLEERFPQLFPTNVRPEAMAQDTAL